MPLDVVNESWEIVLKINNFIMPEIAQSMDNIKAAIKANRGPYCDQEATKGTCVVEQIKVIPENKI